METEEKPLRRVLIIEDQDTLYEQMEAELKRQAVKLGITLEITRTSRIRDAYIKVEGIDDKIETFDAISLDMSLPRFTDSRDTESHGGTEILMLMYALGIDTPTLVYTSYEKSEVELRLQEESSRAAVPHFLQKKEGVTHEEWAQTLLTI